MSVGVAYELVDGMYDVWRVALDWRFKRAGCGGATDSDCVAARRAAVEFGGGDDCRLDAAGGNVAGKANGPPGLAAGRWQDGVVNELEAHAEAETEGALGDSIATVVG